MGGIGGPWGPRDPTDQRDPMGPWGPLGPCGQKRPHGDHGTSCNLLHAPSYFMQHRLPCLLGARLNPNLLRAPSYFISPSSFLEWWVHEQDPTNACKHMTITVVILVLQPRHIYSMVRGRWPRGPNKCGTCMKLKCSIDKTVDFHAMVHVFSISFISEFSMPPIMTSCAHGRLFYIQ